MAGHSKWKNIRIRKGKQDALRGKLFTKLSREIIVAARAGGGDPALNARLRVAVELAKASSLPAENIKRAIDRGTGVIEGAAYEEIVYEGKGPGGAALILQCSTENRNRSVADIRNAFNKNNGQMAENGAVAWQFKHVGQLTLSLAGKDEDELTLAAIEAGAEDVLPEDDALTVITPLADLHRVNTALEKAGHRPEDVGLTYRATIKAELSLPDQRKLLRLLDALDDLDDVQEVYTNVDISDELLDEE
ncbi:MAG: YebC/PmpR family DNA-binding transcriptional regulator [Armatimonadota bacterium]